MTPRKIQSVKIIVTTDGEREVVYELPRVVKFEVATEWEDPRPLRCPPASFETSSPCVELMTFSMRPLPTDDGEFVTIRLGPIPTPHDS